MSEEIRIYVACLAATTTVNYTVFGLMPVWVLMG